MSWIQLSVKACLLLSSLSRSALVIGNYFMSFRVSLAVTTNTSSTFYLPGPRSPAAFPPFFRAWMPPFPESLPQFWSMTEGLLMCFMVLCPCPVLVPSSACWDHALVGIEDFSRAVTTGPQGLMEAGTTLVQCLVGQLSFYPAPPGSS